MAERRKVFELGRFTGPKATRANASSCADSSAYGRESNIRSGVVNSIAGYGESELRCTYPSEMHHPPDATQPHGNIMAQGKWNSVSNLRLTFEEGSSREVQTKVKRLPEKGRRHQHSDGRDPTTPTRKNNRHQETQNRHEETNNRDGEMLGQDGAASLPRRLSAPRPFLRSQILSVKISTVGPKSTLQFDQLQEEASLQHRTGHSDLLPVDKTSFIATEIDPSQEPAMFIPFLHRQRREIAPVKSTPGLPITASTTIAVTSRRASSSSSLLSGSAIDSPKSCDHHNNALPGTSVLFHSGAPGTSPQTTRSRPKHKMESPVKKRITLFENLSHTAVDPTPWATTGRPKSYDCVTVVEERNRRRLPGAEFKLGPKPSRMLSFGSRIERMDKKSGQRKSPDTVGTISTKEASGETNASGSRSNTRQGHLSFLQQSFSRRVPVFTATMHKVSSHDGSLEQPPPGPAAWSSVDLVHGPGTEDDLPSPPATGSVSASAGAPYSPPKSRYPSSFGKKNTDSLKRAVARPVLSPHEGRAVPSRRSNLNISWGRRAAAAAFAIGRRLKERRTSKAQSEASREDGASSSPPTSR